MKFFDFLKLTGRALSLLLASMAPLLFLVGIISAFDRWGAHNRLLQKLETYGRIVDATVSWIDNENGTAGLHFDNAQGEPDFGTLDLYYHYYPPEVIESIQEGDTLRVIYIDALISEGGKAVLLEYYQEIKHKPSIPNDIWGILGISWLIIAIQPQFVFLGMVKFDLMLALAEPTKRV
jgi:hypothetical protein